MIDKKFESCMLTVDTFKAADFIMVIFGGAGDLSQKKLIPTLYLLFKKKLISNFSILGVGLPEMNDGEYKENIRKKRRSGNGTRQRDREANKHSCGSRS